MKQLRTCTWTCRRETSSRRKSLDDVDEVRAGVCFRLGGHFGCWICKTKSNPTATSMPLQLYQAKLGSWRSGKGRHEFFYAVDFLTSC